VREKAVQEPEEKHMQSNGNEEEEAKTNGIKD
jgi:hypothetical protein